MVIDDLFFIVTLINCYIVTLLHFKTVYQFIQIQASC